MINLLIHTALLILVFYLLGCLVGWWLRGLFGAGVASGSARNADAAAPQQPAVVRPAAAAPAASAIETTRVQPALPPVRPFEWSATHAGGRVSLAGHVPTEAVRADLLAAAARHFPGTPVDDHLRLGGGAPLGFAGAAGHGLAQLARLNTGRAVLSDTSLSLAGAAPHAMARDAIRAAALPAGYRFGELALSLAGDETPAADARTVVHPAPRAAPTPLPPVAGPAGDAPGGAGDPRIRPGRGPARRAGGGVTQHGPGVAGPAGPATVVAVDPVIRPWRWQARLAEGVVTMSGHVPDAHARQEIRTAAGAALAGVNLVDGCNPGRGAPDNFVLSAREGVGLLAGLSHGTLSYDDGVLSLSGEAQDGLAALDLRRKLAGLSQGVRLGEVKVSQAFGADASELTSTGVAVAPMTVTPKAVAPATSSAATMAPIAGATPAASIPSAVAAPAPASAPTAAALPKISPWRWGAVHDGRAVRLTGYCPDEATRAGIVAAARAALPQATIDDRMRLAAGAPADFAAAATTATGLLGQLGTATVSLDGTELGFIGEARDGLGLLGFRKGLAALPASITVGATRVAQSFGASPAALTSTGVAVAPQHPVAAMAAPAAGATPAGIVGQGDPSGPGEAASAVAPAVSASAAGSGTGAAPASEEVAALMAAPVTGDPDGSKQAAANAVGDRPVPLAGPREGKADDLKRVRGIGPQNEARLHLLGIWHFDQIAGWTASNARWVGAYLSFPGRIERENWIEQARVLAAGGETDFSARVGRGEVAYTKAVDLAAEAKAIADRYDNDQFDQPTDIGRKS